MHNRTKYLSAIYGGVLIVCFGMGSALAATYTVTKVADTNDGVCNTDCSLREAVIASNTNAGPDIITLRGGIYLLTLIGANEDYGATGDLDIRGDLTINGAAVNRPNVDGNLQDRIFDIMEGVAVNINNVGISNGVLSTFGSGAGMYNRGNTILNNVYFTGNVAAGYGGAIQSRSSNYPYSGQLTILNSYFSKNCSSSGGGMDSSGVTTIINSRFDGNVPIVKGGVDCKNLDGAAIHFQGGYSNIDQSTFINNVGEVGAINIWAGYLTITNTTITNNRGITSSGGIFNEAHGEITLKNSTIAYNTAYQAGGGIAVEPRSGYGGEASPPITLINSIVANNLIAPGGTGGADCAGNIVSNGNNILGTMAGCSVVLQTSDLVGNPQLAALVTSGIAATDVAQSYLPLLASSPAIDSANNTECTTQDQLSQARPVDGNGDGTAVCDRGAYELVSAKNQITVYARGTPLAGVYPTMVVRVNGMVARTFNVNSTVYTGYTLAANVGAAATHKIDVAFTNDAYVPPEDRNLFVQSLRVGTTTFMPGGAGVTYDRGAGNAAYDGVNVIAGQEVMPWNGALRFTVPASAF